MTTGWGMTNWVERVRLRNLFCWELRSLLRWDDNRMGDDILGGGYMIEEYYVRLEIPPASG